RKVKAKPALDLRPKQLQHAARASAEIKQRAEWPVGERGDDRLLDLLISDMQLANAIPFGGMAAEIGLRRGGARGTHRSEALTIACNDRVERIEPRNQRTCQLRSRPALTQPEERPGAFAKPLHQPGLGQKPEMARDARLRLTQNVREL